MTPEDHATARRVLQSISPKPDWGLFLDLAAKHRVLAQVAANFDRHELGPVGMVRHSTLRAYHLYNSARNAALSRELVTILRSMRTAGVQVTMRKGGYLSHVAYPDRGARFMVDLDFFVSKSQSSAFAETLAGLGYQQGSDSSNRRTVKPLDREVGLFWALNVSTLPPFLRPTSDPYIDMFAIDARVDMFEPASGKSVKAEQMLSACSIADFLGEPAMIMSPEDVVIDVTSHLHREATALSSIEAGKDLCLSRFVDVVQLFRSRSRPVRTAELIERCAELDAANEVYFALHYTNELFPEVIPAVVLRALAPTDLSYLDEYGAMDGQPGRWTDGFRARLFDRDRLSKVTQRSALLRPRPQWGQIGDVRN